MCIQNLIKLTKNWINYFSTIISHHLYHSSDPKFSCEIVTPEKIYLVNNEEIKYHNKIRYIYFPSSQFLENYIFNKDGKIIIKIIRYFDNWECSSEFNIEDMIKTENIINGNRVNELTISYPNYSIILRCPQEITRFNRIKGQIIFRYNRDNLELD